VPEDLYDRFYTLVSSEPPNYRGACTLRSRTRATRMTSKHSADNMAGGGGAYARALSEEIVKPGVDSMLVFTRVARRVQREIGQDPFLSESTMPEVYFAGEAVASNASEAERAWGSRRSQAHVGRDQG
jgi:hypothetical protein